MTKNGRQFFQEKMWLSVAAPGDINPSDASGGTVNMVRYVMCLFISQVSPVLILPTQYGWPG